MKGILVVLVLLIASNAWCGGLVSGRVVYQGEVPVSQKWPVLVDAKICGKGAEAEDLVLGKEGSVQNAVVYLQGTVVGGRPLLQREGGVIMNQKGCRFDPHVVVVGKGMDLKMINLDRIVFNLRTVSRSNPPLSIALSPDQPEQTIRFERPEILAVRCDLHNWMKGWIVVADHPYYALTDENGSFRLRDVPAGEYNLALWHEKMGMRTKRIQVREGEETRSDFRLMER